MPGSTKFVRQHFFETVEHKATSRQLQVPVPHQVTLLCSRRTFNFVLLFDCPGNRQLQDLMTCPFLQAPQRERVSLVVRGSVLLQSTGDPLNTNASWNSRITGNNIESVPRLLWLLEPKIVFAHAKVRQL